MSLLLDECRLPVMLGDVAESRITAALAPLHTHRQCAHLRFATLNEPGLAHPLTHIIFNGPPGGGDPVRIGFFAGIHGDETAGVHSLIRFVSGLVNTPSRARGYQLHVYPVCNPSGFEDATRHSRNGKDLNREFWIGSQEPEVQVLEREILSHRFHGLVSLHADDTSEGVYGFVRGAVLSQALLEPALRAASAILPRNRNSIIDGFPARDGIISECYDGILTSPRDLDPTPFELILETPQSAPDARQEEALLLALHSILAEYQNFLSYAADL